MIATQQAVAEEIVEAALGRFLRFGYSHVSTEEIARSIGRSKKTLYKHFPTKEALLRAALARLDRDAQRAITAEAAGRGGDRLARLRAILALAAAHLATTGRVLLADLHAAAPELGRQAAQERREALLGLLAPALDEAVRAGLIRDDLAPGLVVDALRACVEGMVPAVDQPLEGGPPAECFAPLVSLLVDGLRRR